LPGCTAPDDRRSAVARWLVRREGQTRRTRAEGLGTACRTLYTTPTTKSSGVNSQLPNSNFQRKLPSKPSLLGIGSWKLGVDLGSCLRVDGSTEVQTDISGRPRYRVARSRCR